MGEETIGASEMKTPKPPKPARYQTLADFIRDAYGPKRKRLSLGKADLRAMQSVGGPGNGQIADLVTLASGDLTLERTREVLLLAAERLGNHPLAGQVRAFVLDVLQRHPAFAGPEMRGVLENLPDAIGDDEAVRALSGQSFATLVSPLTRLPLKKTEAEQARRNAVYCLMLWMRETRGTSVERIQQHLQSTVWAPAAGRSKTDAQQLRFLLQAKDRAALGIACANLERTVRVRTQEAMAARTAEVRATEQANQLRATLEQVGSELDTRKAEVQRLGEERLRERQAHENALAHGRDEYEKLRGTLLRRLRAEITLLDEGLGALRRQPPKVHVMEDHAERVIQGLKSEIERIKGENE